MENSTIVSINKADADADVDAIADADAGCVHKWIFVVVVFTPYVDAI
jgi:hypothetical protein